MGPNDVRHCVWAQVCFFQIYLNVLLTKFPLYFRDRSTNDALHPPNPNGPQRTRLMRPLGLRYVFLGPKDALDASFGPKVLLFTFIFIYHLFQLNHFERYYGMTKFCVKG